MPKVNFSVELFGRDAGTNHRTESFKRVVKVYIVKCVPSRAQISHPSTVAFSITYLQGRRRAHQLRAMGELRATGERTNGGEPISAESHGRAHKRLIGRGTVIRMMITTSRVGQKVCFPDTKSSNKGLSSCYKNGYQGVPARARRARPHRVLIWSRLGMKLTIDGLTTHLFGSRVTSKEVMLQRQLSVSSTCSRDGGGPIQTVYASGCRGTNSVEDPGRFLSQFIC